MRKPGLPTTSVLLSILAVATILGGCSTFYQGPKRKAVESMLTTAGFRKKVATDPQQLAILESKPQRKVLPLQRNGKKFYGFADAKGCGCAYLGDEAAYRQFQTFMAENKAIDEQQPDHVEYDSPQDVVVVYEDDVWAAWGGDLY